MEVSAKTKEHPEAVTVEYNIPDTLAGLVETFGEEVVVGNAIDSIVISLQAFIRRHIEKPQAEVQALVAKWRPGERQAAVKKTPLERATAALAAMSDEDKTALLAKLRGK